MAEFDTIRTGVTVGMVVHPVRSAAPTASTAAESCLLKKQGTFALCRDPKTNKLAWTVELETRGTWSSRPTATRSASCASTRPILDGSTAIVKSTYNGTSGCLKIFINNTLDASCCPPSAPGGAPSSDGKAAGQPVRMREQNGERAMGHPHSPLDLHPFFFSDDSRPRVYGLGHDSTPDRTARIT